MSTSVPAADYRPAVKALRDKLPADVRRDELVQAIVAACEAARAYNPERDPFKLQRDKIKARDAVAGAARRLATECASGNLLLGAAIPRALDAHGFVLRPDIHRIAYSRELTEDDVPPTILVLGKFLASLAEKLEAADAEDHADPPEMHARRRHGNLEFVANIGRRRLPSVDAMLAFQLEFYFRAYTAGRPFAWSPHDSPTGNSRRGEQHRDLAATMREGKPHRDLIARFVTAAFPRSPLVDATAVGDRVKDLTPRVLWLDDFH